MTRHAIPKGPFSRRVDVATLRDGAKAVRIEADDAERTALAEDCDLPAITALSADLRVARDGEDGVRVTGRVFAEVVQVCVVTLDEVAARIEEPVDVRFAPEAEVDALAVARAARSGDDDPTADDLPDPIVGGRIDLGALVAETMVLGLDPYPRKPGARFDEPAPPDADDRVSPFAPLRDRRPDGA